MAAKAMFTVPLGPPGIKSLQEICTRNVKFYGSTDEGKGY